MGIQTEFAIKEWQAKAGVEPATGERAKKLRGLQQAAFEAIKVAELELSGIRDGDGYWHGADVPSSIADRLIGLCEALQISDDRARADIECRLDDPFWNSSL